LHFKKFIADLIDRASEARIATGVSRNPAGRRDVRTGKFPSSFLQELDA
jgi:hypothetical protein